jgi:hypothetical protein
MKAVTVPVAMILMAAPLFSRPLQNDAASERAALAQAADAHPDNLEDQLRYAEFLDRYGDPGARAAYAKTLAAAQRAGDSTRAGAVARKLAIFDLLAGDRDAAGEDAEAYHSATGKTLTFGKPGPAEAWPTVPIPGPLRSFARMAAISPDSRPQDILPALAHNVITNGYEASHGNEALEQTEYLKLVHRYLSQARELDKLASDQHVIEVKSCDAPNVADLLRVLGLRMRGGCGSELVLETVNAARAFLTTDSGFPVNQLEEALRTNRPFSYDFHAARVPVLFGPEYWLGGAKDADPLNFIEAFVGDPAICRLYLGFSKLDPQTAEALRKASTQPRLKAYAHVLDFFGGMFEIRDGKAVVPGGQRSAAMWGELVGASPDHGGEFFDKLIVKDDGWLCSLYDALARIRGPVRDYLTEPARMKRFYSAVRGRITSPGPARPVFRSNTDMMLLTTRLQIDPTGKPHIPGNLEVWRTLFTNSPQGKYDGKLTRLATTWKDSDDVLEALFALCRKSVENEPLKIFMALTDVDRNRPTPLAPATVDRLARSYHAYGSQYQLLSESRRLSDQSIIRFLDAAEAIRRTHDPLFRSDVAGSFQSLMGLWQIFVRQGNIPDDQADAAFSGIATPFAAVKNDRELFEASRNGLTTLLGGALPNDPQQRMIDLLAGAGTSEDIETRDVISEDMIRILDAQHIISLDTLLQLADLLERVGNGTKLDTVQANKLAARIAEVPLPRPPLTANEKNAMGFGYYTDRHLDAERRLNLRLAMERAGGDPAKLKELIGDLAPLMRDTLVAFNYVYYAPPGAQILYTNPVFVRSHDFVGGEGQSRTWAPTETYGTGWPSNGGGRLVGSLSGLPYTLAEAEQNFLVPTQTQALIWGDLVPQMILSAKLPRWWNVTPQQVHWVALHLRYGRELLAESAFDPQLRAKVETALSALAAPGRTGEVNRLLEQGQIKEALDRVTPSELFLLAREVGPDRPASSSCLLAEIRHLAETSPKEINYAAISRAFGTPKPTLANSYEPELLNLRTFPTLMGYSSRIMAESWESNTLFWAALADETGLRPTQLNVQIPAWTQRLVEHIFASHLEDWPAVLKSLRNVGDDVRKSARASAAGDQKASLEIQTGK